MLPKYADIVELIKKGSTLEAQEKIMELRETALELQEENLRLKERIGDLEATLKVKGSIIYENNAYWLAEGENKDGPFCQRCYDAEKTLIRLHKARFQRPSDRQWSIGGKCRKCGGEHEVTM